MNKGDEILWTIDELSERVAEVLRGSSYDGVPSGRVRDVPDLRTIRYYTTLGLLDRPAAMRGRTALYRRRHLLQLIAIKHLQARGLSLAEVQQRVLGLSDSALQRIIAVDVASNKAPPAGAPAPRSESFWRIADDEYEPPANALNHGVREIALENGLGLRLPVQRQLDEEDLRVIRMAAAPLIELLRLRGLIGIGRAQRKEGDE
jgi:DNA-binding transcriptional MerR regulator